MSKYNRYAKELNEAFRSAADQYGTAYQKWQEALQRQQKGVSDSGETYPGSLADKQKQLEFDTKEAEAELRKVQREAWNGFYNTRDRLTRDLEHEVQKSFLANPDDLDNATMQILNSGIANADDLASLAERFSDNPTMLRMIGAKASELSDGEKDMAVRSKLNETAYICENTRPEVLDAWHNLVNASQHYTGEISRERDPEYIMKISDHWNDENVQTMIEDF